MRIERSHFGDHTFLREGVWERRNDVEPGYRIYYAKSGLTLVLLLWGGDKRQQDAAIARACEYWHDGEHSNERENKQ